MLSAPRGWNDGRCGGFGQGPTTGTGIPPFKPFVSEEKSNGRSSDTTSK